jgi:hypothetical protein
MSEKKNTPRDTKGEFTMKDEKMGVSALALVVTMLVVLLLVVDAHAASWTSGWVSINQNQKRTFTHNLGINPNNYTVDLWFQDTVGALGIHRRNYGGLETNGNWFGANWQDLTATTVEVYRQPNDTTVNLIRVDVRPLPLTTAHYDSGWVNINPGTRTFNHNLNITATDLTVGLFFQNTALGIHQRGYGGLSIDAPAAQRGAFWHNLTNNSVQVTRMPDDPWVVQARVLVMQSTPSYDSYAASGWRDLAAGSPSVFTHNLNWNPDLLIVRGECNDTNPGGLGINHKASGGDHDTAFRGMNIQNLTANAVTAFRRQDDANCPQARIVIYKRFVSCYLPLILR